MTSTAEFMHINGPAWLAGPSMAADIIAMPSNPLQDIESLRKINFVMKGGLGIDFS